MRQVVGFSEIRLFCITHFFVRPTEFEKNKIQNAFRALWAKIADNFIIDPPPPIPSQFNNMLATKRPLKNGETDRN